MLGSYARIFRSRWWALLWAAGIIWMAYDFTAPSGDGGNDAAADADVAALRDAVNGL
ncbi:MAG: hypothetical protein ACJ8EB_04940 [Allosphingosinicella sp.]|jgi:hypothetical protein